MKRVCITLAAAALLTACFGLQGASADDTQAPAKDSTAPTKDSVPLAADSSMPQFTFNVIGATDYLFRGVSQTENNPAIFGKAQVSYEQFYAGFGMENVDFHNGTDGEYDLSAGWKPSAEGFDFDLGVIRYGYIDEPSHVSIDTVELKGGVSHGFGPVTLGAAVFFAPDYFGTSNDGTYVEGNAVYNITDQISASGALGYQSINAGGDYTTWNIGAGYAFTKNIAVDFRYYDTNEHQLGSIYGSHFVAAIKTSF